MSVSYLSNRVIESSPYVQPVSLDILARVGTFKQGQYDANYQRIQSQIDNIVSKTQGMNDVQRGYVTNKLNSLVNNINDLGGVDLSDLNIANQIDGYASSIYGDDNVVKFINNASSVSAYMASKQKMLSDPKMMKFYSEANAYDAEKEINRYYSSNNINDNFNIQSSIKPWRDVSSKLLKAEKNIKANLVEVEGIKGVYKVKNTSKIVRDEDIERMVYAELDAEDLAQIKRDANFTYEKLYQGDKNRLIGAAKANEQAKINRKKNDLAKYAALHLADQSNPAYANAVKSLKTEIEEDEKIMSLQEQIFEERFKKDKESFQFDTYINSIVSGKIAKLAYTEETKSMSLDPFVPVKSAREIAQANLDFKYKQLNEQTKLKERELNLQEAKLRGEYEGADGSKIKNSNSPDFVNAYSDGNMSVDEKDREEDVRSQLAGIQTQSKKMIVDFFVDEFRGNSALNLSPEDIEKVRLYFDTQVQDYNKDGVINNKDIVYSNLDFTKGAQNDLNTKKIKIGGKEQFVGNLIMDTYRNVFNLFEESAKDDFNYSEYKGVKSPKLQKLLSETARLSKEYEVIQSQLAYPNTEDKEKDIQKIAQKKLFASKSTPESLYRTFAPDSWQVSEDELPKKNKFFGNQYSEVYFNEAKMKQISQSGVINRVRELLPEDLAQSKDLKILSLSKNYASKDKPWKVVVQAQDSKGKVFAKPIQIDETVKDGLVGRNNYTYSKFDDYIGEGNVFDTEPLISPTGFTYKLKALKNSDGSYRTIYTTKDKLQYEFNGGSTGSESLERAIKTLNALIQAGNFKNRAELDIYIKKELNKKN